MTHLLARACVCGFSEKEKRKKDVGLFVVCVGARASNACDRERALTVRA